MNPNTANIPPALKREPWMAVFFVVFAPFLFPAVFTVLAVAILPESVRADRVTLFLVLALASTCLFAAASYWSESIGAGAFAGRLRGKSDWFVAALLLGPVILFGASIMMAAVSGFEAGWQFADAAYAATLDLSFMPLSLIVYAVLVAPFVEEVIYRGIGVGALMARGVGAPIALGLTSVAFAMVHLQYSPAGMMAVFLAALGFGWLRIASGSVGVAIVAHMSANGTMLLIQSAVAQAPAT